MRFVLAHKGAIGSDRPVFPLACGVPRVYDRRVVSGIIFILKNGLND